MMSKRIKPVDLVVVVNQSMYTVCTFCIGEQVSEQLKEQNPVEHQSTHTHTLIHAQTHTNTQKTQTYSTDLPAYQPTDRSRFD